MEVEAEGRRHAIGAVENDEGDAGGIAGPAEERENDNVFFQVEVSGYVELDREAEEGEEGPEGEENPGGADKVGFVAGGSHRHGG